MSLTPSFKQAVTYSGWQEVQRQRGANSPVEFGILLGKITIKQINSLSYTKFSEEYENDPCQVVSFGEKKL